MPQKTHQKELREFWITVKDQAILMAQQEPFLASAIHERILAHEEFCGSLAHILALHLGDKSMGALELQNLISSVYREDAEIVYCGYKDLDATLTRDPAVNSPLEPMLFLKGFQALQAYRIAHHLWIKERRFLALWLQSTISRVFAVDIHPGARIGRGILLDHATDLVIGETAVVGNNVSILHGVTLGGTGKDTGDRHPKVEDGVLLAAHAQLLGNIRIGTGAKIGAGAVVLTDVPAHTTYAGVPAKRVGVPESKTPAMDMTQFFCEDSSQL